MSVRNVLDWLEEAARLAPGSIAVDTPNKAMTWEQVWQAAQETGSFLAAQVDVQQPVLILMDKSPDCLCAMLGAVCAGCFYTPLDASMPPARIRLIADTLRPAAIVFSRFFTFYLLNAALSLLLLLPGGAVCGLLAPRRMPTVTKVLAAQACGWAAVLATFVASALASGSLGMATLSAVGAVIVRGVPGLGLQWTVLPLVVYLACRSRRGFDE